MGERFVVVARKQKKKNNDDEDTYVCIFLTRPTTKFRVLFLFFLKSFRLFDHTADSLRYYNTHGKKIYVRG